MTAQRYTDSRTNANMLLLDAIAVIALSTASSACVFVQRALAQASHRRAATVQVLQAGCPKRMQ
jgi:hypothetical protein